MLTEEKLLKLKEDIGHAKVNLAELNGQRKQMMKDLQETWGCNSLAEGEEMVKKLGERMDTLQKNINNRLEALSKKYPIGD